MTIEAMIDATIGREGGYSNHPADRGGETIWGITAAVARRNGYAGAMRSMPREASPTSRKPQPSAARQSAIRLSIAGLLCRR